MRTVSYTHLDVYKRQARNIAAIRTLFQLEQEHRGATAEEQEVLSQYVGWGGLPDAFDPDKSNWSKEYTELKGLLSEDEYAAARSSVLNAHYTSPTAVSYTHLPHRRSISQKIRSCTLWKRPARTVCRRMQNVRALELRLRERLLSKN